jgi:hypothetical protein
VKTCPSCGPQPDSEFHADAHHPDGLASLCKDCRSAYRREYGAANKDRLTAANREYRRQVRAKVLGHYGTSCACCGAVKALTIDHVAGGGSRHRADLFGGKRWDTHQFRLWLIREGFPAGYQTLCTRCNSSKFTGPTCRLVHTR